MLTASQCEVVAFQTDDGFICKSCAIEHYGETRVVATEAGFGYGDLSPIIEFTMSEYNGERVYEAAEELLDERADQYALDPRESWQILDDIVEELGDSYNEACADCYSPLG